MPILPPLKPFFEATLKSSDQPDPRPITDVRAGIHAMMDTSYGAFVAQQAPLPSERDHQVAVDGGTITVRVYSPAPDAVLPGYLYLHGGGFFVGTLEHSDATCRAIAAEAGCVVASVDYRLAPEAKYPAAAEDCFAALRWVAANAGALGVDPARLAVGGGSAGGNLAAVVALMARDRGGPALALQVLEIPVTDLTRVEPLAFPDEDLIVPSGKPYYRDLYLTRPEQASEHYASPIFAADLAGLPPALVMTAEYDPLRPEGEAYADRLRAAGVAVEYHCWPGQFHGSQNLAALIPDEAAAYQAAIVAALEQAFAAAG